MEVKIRHILNNGDTLQGVNPKSTDIAITSFQTFWQLKDAMASVNSVIGSQKLKMRYWTV